MAAAAVTLLAGFAPAAAWADDWGTQGLDLAHTRLAAERSGASFGEGSWTASSPNSTAASPAVADGLVVTADLQGVVTALRADTGAQVWRVSLGSMVQGTPTIVRGRVFVGTASYTLFALRLTDGATLWTQDIGGMTFSSPTAVDGDIIVTPGLPLRNLMRLSGETGEIVWQTPPTQMWQFSNSTPAVSGGLVVVASQQGHLYGFDASSGALRWEYIGDGVVNLAAPLIVGGRVYMAGGDASNRVHAVDLVTGQAVPGWPITLPTLAPDIAGTLQGTTWAVSSFAAVGGLLLLETRQDDGFGPRNGPFYWVSREVVFALAPSSGAIIWRRALARAENDDVNNVPKFDVCPTPAAFPSDDGSLLVAVGSSLDPVIAVLDVASGTERARNAAAGPALASPVVSNGRLYITTIKGITQALGSSGNHAPTAPVAAQYGTPIDLANPTLSWSAAADSDGETASYELRIGADGDLLHSWQQQTFVNAGVTATRITAALVPDVTYTFAVRARDPHGALSPWSVPSAFTVTGTSLVATTGGTNPPPGSTNPPPDGTAPAHDTTTPPGMGPPPSGTNPPVGTMMALVAPTAGGGCAIGGGTGGSWAAALIVSTWLALGARRRRIRKTVR